MRAAPPAPRRRSSRPATTATTTATASSTTTSSTPACPAATTSATARPAPPSAARPIRNLPGNACPLDHVNDKLYCRDGNPGYPVTGPDLCDGTDDNCNGVANDEPPLACFTDVNGTLPGGQGRRRRLPPGIQQCVTAPLRTGHAALPRPAGPRAKPAPTRRATYGACQGVVAARRSRSATASTTTATPASTTTCMTRGSTPTAARRATSADCDNTGTGTRCKRGKWQCAQPAARAPRAPRPASARSPRARGLRHDRQRLRRPRRRRPRRRHALHRPRHLHRRRLRRHSAAAWRATCAPQCVQTVGPTPETCNGIDDNCNGQIDDNNPPLAVESAARRRRACIVPMPPANQPPCKAGVTVCVAGMIQCQGAVGPMPNQCNGISTDCTGNPNTNGNCPTGFQCYQGNCVAPCDASEFPCPGGYVCDMNTTACDMNGNHPGCACPTPARRSPARSASTASSTPPARPSCIDPCTTSPARRPTSASSARASTARAVRRAAPTVRSASRTDDNMFACQPDPCADVTCGSDQFCQAGVCVGACAGPCPNGRVLRQGRVHGRSLRAHAVRRGPGLPRRIGRRRLRRERVPVRLQHRPGLLRRRVRRRRVREPALPGGHALHLDPGLQRHVRDQPGVAEGSDRRRRRRRLRLRGGGGSSEQSSSAWRGCSSSPARCSGDVAARRR